MAASARRPNEQSWSATDEDIMRLCVYLTDDSTVAAYHGTTVDRVAKVRAKMAKRYLKVVPDVTAKHEEVINASTQKTEGEARDGSAQLLERINGLYRRFARQQGFGVDDAMVVQQFGWNVWRKLKAAA